MEPCWSQGQLRESLGVLGTLCRPPSPHPEATYIYYIHGFPALQPLVGSRQQETGGQEERERLGHLFPISLSVGPCGSC